MATRYRTSLYGLLAALFLAQPCLLTAQDLQPWLTGYHSDSSLYEVARIDASTWWIAGENGLLRSVDSSGRCRVLSLPGSPVNLLRIRPAGRFVFVAGDQGTLFRYDKMHDSWQRWFLGARYRRSSFYDLLVLPDGDLLLAGGHQEIAKGKLALPRGFILQIDSACTREPVVRWSRPQGFVWALAADSSGTVYASTYDGLHSRLIRSTAPYTTFDRIEKIDGLVHHLCWSGETLWYSGACSLRYTRDGIVGQVGEATQVLVGYGCIWSLVPTPQGWLGLSQSGHILAWQRETDKIGILYRAPHALYEGASLSPSQYLLAGHGRQVMVLRLDKQDYMAMQP
ncbi:MAG: hypothetical protein OHK0039_13770 [Bacteroidia bacterium]